MSDSRENTLMFVREVMQQLANAHITTWLCGGWAEELWGQFPPRAHNDVDLLYPASNFARLDEWLSSSTEFAEIPAKRFSHKRSFLHHGIMIELFLLETDENGSYQTNFFDGSYCLRWPHKTLQTLTIHGQDITVASEEALRKYRIEHQNIAEAYHRYQLRAL